MQSKIIAAGELVKTDDLRVVAEVAELYADAANESGSNEESGSAAVEAHYVSLHMVKSNGDELPAENVSFDDIKAAVEEAGAEMKVPGLNGGDAIELEAPVVLKSSRMKSFMCDGTANIIADLRYEF